MPKKKFSKSGSKPHVVKEKDKYTPELDDKLLDLYFSNRGWETIAKETGKNVGSLERRSTRLICGVRNCKNYTITTERIDRTGLPFSPREVDATKDCLRSEDKETSLTREQKLEHLASIFNRSLQDIKKHLNRNLGRKGFGLL